MNRDAAHQMIEALPQSGTWTPAERDAWLRAFTGIIDYLMEVAERNEGR